MPGAEVVLKQMVKPRVLLMDEIKFYKERGYLKLPALVSPEEASLLRHEILESFERMGVSMTKLYQHWFFT